MTSARDWANSYERQVNRNLKYQELVQRKIEAHKTNQAFIELRKDWLQNQKTLTIETCISA